MNNPTAKVSSGTRLGCAFAGWLGGNVAAILSFELYEFVLTGLRHERLGGFLLEWERMAFFSIACALVSLVGWALVGLPIVMVLPLRTLVRLNWSVILLIGAALGPIAFFLMILTTSGGQLDVARASLPGTGGFWGLSVLISTIAFATYSALVRRAAR